MDRKKFCKTTCGLGIASCAGLSFLSGEVASASGASPVVTGQQNPLVAVDLRQIQNVLKYVDSMKDESVKAAVFERLGFEHVTSESYHAYLVGFRKDIKSYFDNVNTGKDKYWEKMEWDPEKSEIRVTGKVVDRCACSYAQCENPPLSLCNYCCKNFQKSMFELMLDRKVDVRIDAAFLLGDKRCSTTIFVEGGLPLEKIA